jgi:hypothetical protein
MKLVACAGAHMVEETILREVVDILTTGDSLVLTWGDEDTWMNVGPSGDTVTDDYVLNTLRPPSSRWDRDASICGGHRGRLPPKWRICLQTSCRQRKVFSMMCRKRKCEMGGSACRQETRGCLGARRREVTLLCGVGTTTERPTCYERDARLLPDESRTDSRGRLSYPPPLSN